MRLIVMAWRNLWRYRRRTAVTVAAMTLALLVMVLYTSLVEGYLRGLERNIVDIELGDVQVFAPGYRDNPSLYRTIEQPEQLMARLRDAGFRVSARLLGGGLAAAGEASAGVVLEGIDAPNDRGVSAIHTHVAQGAWLDPADTAGVVVGQGLAHTLNVRPGDELILLSQAADGSIANDLYTVRGVLKAIGDETDRAGVIMTASAFRTFFVLQDGAHQLIVRKPAEEDLASSGDRIRAIATGLDVQTWRDLVPLLASLLDSTRALIQVVFLVIYLVVVILLVNATLMAVFERIRELGVLKAIGVGPGLIMMLILLEGGLQAAIAVVVGLALSVPGLLYLTRYGLDLSALGGTSFAGIAFDPVWRGVVTPMTIVAPVVTLLFMVGISVLYPALKAARLRPVEAMRHQ
jgi:ABC-type lipoprotein release transport system permease subunit